MPRIWFPSCLLLVAALAAHADGAPEQAAVAHVPAAARLKQQLKAHGTEVARLQLQVDKQESSSRAAVSQLEEKDRLIAELQRQLVEAARSQTASAAGQ
ncbi:MAG TPA: hypothetical protein VGU65_08325 [Frateuria sp.]|uniref:hypothetical protein n=1 Tax=Frateuria sp. TaxID=2211372 RepID=UPI002DEA892A|nr:hypothetical protein [Frateuria sp.]